MIDGRTIGVVLDAMRLERAALLTLLTDRGDAEWARPTECPAYTIKGVAAHILGDDLSLLSRQRDGAESGLLQLATTMPGSDFRTLLDTFNDRWVAAAQFLSPELLVELLRLTGDWTAAYYEGADPLAPGEPVGFFGAFGASSPMWQSVAREYVERWVHHSQIRRALGLGSLADDPFVAVGAGVVAAASGLPLGEPTTVEAAWLLGEVTFGPVGRTADLLTRAHDAATAQELLSGPADQIETLAPYVFRP
ncbi:MAG: maleylpyruvate isomerase family mycothiol-dependent enzyme [Acidimicrobiales bacterium]|nr:maleylpyruvate isomerase family mycothiol-dependent enzyme [Acidimicrobiales bacterium]